MASTYCQSELLPCRPALFHLKVLPRPTPQLEIKILRSVSYSNNLYGSGPCIRHSSPGDPCRKLKLSTNAVVVTQVCWTTAKQRLSKEGEGRLSKTKQLYANITREGLERRHSCPFSCLDYRCPSLCTDPQQ